MGKKKKTEKDVEIIEFGGNGYARKLPIDKKIRKKMLSGHPYIHVERTTPFIAEVNNYMKHEYLFNPKRIVDEIRSGHINIGIVNKINHQMEMFGDAEDHVLRNFGFIGKQVISDMIANRERVQSLYNNLSMYHNDCLKFADHANTISIVLYTLSIADDMRYFHVTTPLTHFLEGREFHIYYAMYADFVYYCHTYEKELKRSLTSFVLLDDFPYCTDIIDNTCPSAMLDLVFGSLTSFNLQTRVNQLESADIMRSSGGVPPYKRIFIVDKPMKFLEFLEDPDNEKELLDVAFESSKLIFENKKQVEKHIF